MKKVFFSLAMLLAAQVATAQTVISNNYDSPITKVDGTNTTNNTETDGFVQGDDYSFTINTDQDLYGIKYLFDVSKSAYFGLGFNLGTGDYSSYSSSLFLGLGKRYLLGNSFLLQGKLGVYGGYMSYEVPTVNDKGKVTKKDKDEFIYGAEANVAAGLKLWTTKKGTRGFITVGYYMSAPKFKTDNMGDNGAWCFGITLVK